MTYSKPFCRYPRYNIFPTNCQILPLWQFPPISCAKKRFLNFISTIFYANKRLTVCGSLGISRPPPPVFPEQCRRISPILVKIPLLYAFFHLRNRKVCLIIHSHPPMTRHMTVQPHTMTRSSVTTKSITQSCSSFGISPTIMGSLHSAALGAHTPGRYRS